MKWLLNLAVASSLMIATSAWADAPAANNGLTIVIMDPLAAPLSCPCVEGYAQRKYEVLGKYLQKRVGRDVKVVFAEALETALKGDAQGKADLIIGKESVVHADAKEQSLKITPISRLTGKDGSTTQTGLIVVAKDDDAKSVKDLSGYRIFFGPAECDEKHSAALALLRSANVTAPKKLEIDTACSDGASKVLELSGKAQAAAVISSYAAPLLEGCGTIKKGDLRVVGETKPVPFITAFVTQNVDSQLRSELQTAMLEVSAEPDLLIALESLLGFVPLETKDQLAAKKK